MLEHLIAGALLAATGISAGDTPAPVELALSREYGRALYRECRLTVGVVEEQGRASLDCVVNREPAAILSAERALRPDEAEAFSALVAGSDLCGGGHLGEDSRAVDGTLETLLARCPDKRSAVLITSGNPTFEAAGTSASPSSGARTRLLVRLRALEDELRKKLVSP